jgi:outer membrane protein assembly factor BamD (BamD/ComL family)
MFGVLAGCSDKKAAEIYETAKFEELQNNNGHAIKLYERIIVTYPSSEYAVRAKERIEALREQSKIKNIN